MPREKSKPAHARRSPSPRRRPVEVIAGPIARDRTLGKETTWVIAGEVRVRRGVTLKIADGATLLIANGVLPKSRLRLRGVFGDQLALSSPDMPRPNTAADNERPYAYSGRLTADAVIHSLTAD